MPDEMHPPLSNLSIKSLSHSRLQALDCEEVARAQEEWWTLRARTSDEMTAAQRQWWLRWAQGPPRATLQSWEEWWPPSLAASAESVSLALLRVLLECSRGRALLEREAEAPLLLLLVATELLPHPRCVEATRSTLERVKARTGFFVPGVPGGLESQKDDAAELRAAATASASKSEAPAAAGEGAAGTTKRVDEWKEEDASMAAAAKVKAEETMPVAAAEALRRLLNYTPSTGGPAIVTR